MKEGDARTILVVEDSDEDWDSACEAALQAGLDGRLHRVAGGVECLAWLEAGATGAPALLLMDLNMPGFDGRELLQRVKADARWKSLPVVVLTTSASPRDVAACYAAGATAYHVKPLRYPDHVALLRAVFTYWSVHARLPPAPGAVR